MEIKIVGIVIALLPLKSPASLYRWFLTWKRNQILIPGLQRHREAMQRLTQALERFIQAAKDAGIEEE